MDLGLTEIQLMLKNSAKEFLSQECPLTFVREMENNSQGYTEEFWQQFANLGWTGLAFPEVYGGTGGNFPDLAVLLEEMGRTLFASPFISTSLRIAVLLRLGEKNSIGICSKYYF